MEDVNVAGNEMTEEKPEEKPATVTMGQAELDRLIGKAYAKGMRAARRAAAAQALEAAENNEKTEEERQAEAGQRAAEMMEAAGKKLMAGTVHTVGAGMGLDAKRAKAALALCTFEDCADTNGDIDEEAVAAKLEGFLEEWPELARKAAPPPPYAAGTGSNPMLEADGDRGALPDRKALNTHRITK